LCPSVLLKAYRYVLVDFHIHVVFNDEFLVYIFMMSWWI
jgi:hypothetical protein